MSLAEWKRVRDSLVKPSRDKRRRSHEKDRLELEAHEKSEKAKVRRRDKGCRFPQCDCRRRRPRPRLEVSHDAHKGKGGNPSGDRSVAERMILFCVTRHQEGVVSRHHGTLKTEYLTSRKSDGPLEFWIRFAVSSPWELLARERSVGVLEYYDADLGAEIVWKETA
jgi:hypothetical protein